MDLKGLNVISVFQCKFQKEIWQRSVVSVEIRQCLQTVDSVSKASRKKIRNGGRRSTFAPVRV